MIVEASEVGVRVISVPVKEVGSHLEVVAGDVGGRVANVVPLIPQDPPTSRWSGNQARFQWQAEVRSDLFSAHRALDHQ